MEIVDEYASKILQICEWMMDHVEWLTQTPWGICFWMLVTGMLVGIYCGMESDKADFNPFGGMILAALWPMYIVCGILVVLFLPIIIAFGAVVGGTGYITYLLVRRRR